MKLIKGDVATAEARFISALAEDISFPYARTNLGYTYLAQGRYEAARKTFQSVSEDPQIQVESMRDVTLARVALAHIEAGTAPEQQAAAAYKNVMKELKLFDYEGVEPQSLRLALIHAELGDKLYQDPKYYGLEVFALTMYARAYLEAKKAQELGAGTQAKELQEQAGQSFKKLKIMVHPDWFVFQPLDGFFRPVYDVNTELELILAK